MHFSASTCIVPYSHQFSKVVLFGKFALYFLLQKIDAGTALSNSAI